jgi:hypothetical protein
LAPQLAWPLQVLPPPSQLKSHSAPGRHSTFRQLPEPWQSNEQLAPLRHTVPSQLLPPPEQSKLQVASLSQTSSWHWPLLLQENAQVAS